MTIEEFEKFKVNFILEEKYKEKHDLIHEKFEMRGKGAIVARDRARQGLANEEISVTLYDWIQKYLSLTNRYEVIDNVVLQNKLGSIRIDYITSNVEFIENS